MATSSQVTNPPNKNSHSPEKNRTSHSVNIEVCCRMFVSYILNDLLQYLPRIATIIGHIEPQPTHEQKSKGRPPQRTETNLLFIDNLFEPHTVAAVFRLIDSKRNEFTFANIFTALENSDVSLLVDPRHLPLPSASPFVPFLLLLLYVRLIKSTPTEAVELYSLLFKLKYKKLDFGYFKGKLKPESFINGIVERRIRFYHSGDTSSRHKILSQLSIHFNELFEMGTIQFLNQQKQAESILLGEFSPSLRHTHNRSAFEKRRDYFQHEDSFTRIREYLDKSDKIVLYNLRFLSERLPELDISLFSERNRSLLKQLIDLYLEGKLFNPEIVEHCLKLFIAWCLMQYRDDILVSVDTRASTDTLSFVLDRVKQILSLNPDREDYKHLFPFCIVYLGAAMRLLPKEKANECYNIIKSLLSQKPDAFLQNQQLSLMLTGLGYVMSCVNDTQLLELTRLLLNIWDTQPSIHSDLLKSHPHSQPPQSQSQASPPPQLIVAPTNEIEETTPLSSASFSKIVDPIIKTTSIQIEPKSNSDSKELDNNTTTDNSSNNKSNDTLCISKKENSKIEGIQKKDDTVARSNDSFASDNNGMRLKSDLISTSFAHREADVLYNLSHALQLFRLFRYVYIARSEQERHRHRKNSPLENLPSLRHSDNKLSLPFLATFWRSSKSNAKVVERTMPNEWNAEFEWASRLIDVCSSIFDTRSENAKYMALFASAGIVKGMLTSDRSEPHILSTFDRLIRNVTSRLEAMSEMAPGELRDNWRKWRQALAVLFVNVDKKYPDVNDEFVISIVVDVLLEDILNIEPLLTNPQQIETHQVSPLFQMASLFTRTIGSLFLRMDNNASGQKILLKFESFAKHLHESWHNFQIELKKLSAQRKQSQNQADGRSLKLQKEQLEKAMKPQFNAIFLAYVFLLKTIIHRVTQEQCYRILEFLSYIEFCSIKGFEMYKELLVELVSRVARHEPNTFLNKILEMIPIAFNEELRLQSLPEPKNKLLISRFLHFVNVLEVFMEREDFWTFENGNIQYEISTLFRQKNPSPPLFTDSTSE